RVEPAASHRFLRSGRGVEGHAGHLLAFAALLDHGGDRRPVVGPNADERVQLILVIDDRVLHIRLALADLFRNVRHPIELFVFRSNPGLEAVYPQLLVEVVGRTDELDVAALFDTLGLQYGAGRLAEVFTGDVIVRADVIRPSVGEFLTDVRIDANDLHALL